MVGEAIYKVLTSRAFLLGTSETLIILGALALGASLFGNIPPGPEKGIIMMIGLFGVFGGTYYKYLLKKILPK